MTSCVVYPVETGDCAGFHWRWRSAHAHSEHDFTFFYDCVKDASEHGYRVNMRATIAASRNPEKRTAGSDPHIPPKKISSGEERSLQRAARVERKVVGDPQKHRVR